MSGFFALPRRALDTSCGPVDVPILYQEVRSLIALFVAAAAPARRLLAEAQLEPVCGPGGGAIAALAFYDYRRSSIGPYLEVGTALLARRAGEPASRLGVADLLRSPARRHVGAFVVDLPVTTSAADTAGRELWGYPKFVTELEISHQGRDFRGLVREPGAAVEICRLTGRLGLGIPSPPLSLMTYSTIGATLLRTHVDVRGLSWAHAPGDLRLVVGSSRHRMAAHLRELAIDGARPTLVLSGARLRSRLHAGTAPSGPVQLDSARRRRAEEAS
jgi:hypothetical protein